MRISITNPGKPADLFTSSRISISVMSVEKNLLPTSPERIERPLPLKSSAKFPISWKK